MNINWESRLFRANQSRGLSGGKSNPTIAFEKGNSFYNFRLRRHRARSSVINEPLTIWGVHETDKPSFGLVDHIANEADNNLIDFTDVLIILSNDDFAQTDANWLQRAEQVLTFSFANFCEIHGIGSPFPQRPLGVHILCDGSNELNGHEFGLERGEFISGLVPNLYTHPLPESTPELTIHISVPGAWTGFREIGSLYNDQAMFTIGNHWLDNFQHDQLREPAIYQIYRDEHDEFRHMINPDLHGHYLLSHCRQNGLELIIIGDRSGNPIAYVSLTLTGTTIGDLAKAITLDEAGGESLIPKPAQARIFGLQECGALLQKVHFKRFMEGYDVYLSRSGDLSTISQDTAATFEVRRTFVALAAEQDGILVDGVSLATGERVELSMEHVIEIPGHKIHYSSLKTTSIRGWPYVGQIRRPASSTYIPFGETHQVGRSRECRIVLPDQTNNTNIKWLAAIGDGAMIQSKSGEIPKAKFYTDSIMVGSQHAQLNLSAKRPILSAINKNCFVFIRRGETVQPLHPTKSHDEVHDGELSVGDELLIGNCLYKVSFETPGETAPPIPAPDLAFEGTSEAFSAESSAEDSWFEDDASAPPDMIPPPPPVQTVDAPRDDLAARPPVLPVATTDDDVIAFDDMDPPQGDQPEVTPPILQVASPPRAFDLDDIPAAAGLGEKGDAPSPLAFNDSGYDSIIGDSFEDLRAEAQDILAARDARAAASAAREREADVPPPPPPPALDPDVLPMELPPMDPPTPALSEPVPEAPDDDDFAEPTFPAIPTDLFSPTTESIDDPLDRASQRIASDSHDEDVHDQTADEDASDAPSKHVAAVHTHADPKAPIEHQRSDHDPENLASETPTLPPATQPATIPPKPATPPSTVDAEQGWGTVVTVREDNAQFELGRTMHFIHIGWMVNGTCVIGNHTNCDVIIPENQLLDDQAFAPTDYFALRIRGRRGHLNVLEADETYINGSPPNDDSYADLTDMEFEVIRRDDELEEDFTVRLSIQEDTSLPDPRARLLAVDVSDPLTASLFTKGLPKRTKRTLNHRGFALSLTLDDETVTVSEYLASYKNEHGFEPFFVQRSGGRFKTAPEDGADIQLAAGDKVMIGTAIFKLVTS